MRSAVTPEGPGSVSGAPNLPAGFADTFRSLYVDTGELRLHAVTGGEGPPLLLDRGGHFAAWEQPQLFACEVRAGFRPLR